jgi:serine protease AprX
MGVRTLVFALGLLVTPVAGARSLLLPCENRPPLSQPDDLSTDFRIRRARLLDRLERAIERQAADARRRFGAIPGIESIEPLWLVHALRVTGTAEALAEVERRWIGGAPTWETRTSRRAAFDWAPVGGADDPWNLRRVGADALWQKGIRGQGVRIAILDGGFALDHAELLRPDGATIEGWDFVRNGPLKADRDGHGTAAAGIAAGRTTGVAPDASLWVARVCCDDDEGLFETTVWRAVESALRRDARVLSMSLGVKAFELPNAALWRRAGAVVLAADALWVVSAGNRPHDPLGAPAANPPPWATGGGAAGDGRTATLAIGASDEWDRPRDLSAHGIVRWLHIPPYFDFPHGIRKPELCAPSEVRAPAPNGGYRNFAGTSAATPHVAGVAALLWSARPDLPASVVAESLRDGAVPVAASPERCGEGRVDAERSFVRLLGRRFR